jgi:DNA polymerase V
MPVKVRSIRIPSLKTRLKRPLALVRLPAGFPSPAEDYLEGSLDLNRHLVRHKAATFYFRVTGDSMKGAGIQSGDLLVVDRALEPFDGSVVVAVVGGDFTVKRLRLKGGKPRLEAENPSFAPRPLSLGEASDLKVWGVVTFCIHAVAP